MSTIPKVSPGSLDPAVCWDVLERVAVTPSLKRAARLRDFLLYVGTKALKEGRTDIHEQEIGEAVFGRPQAYDTSQDNIVRVSATELRKRVDAYFAAEGSGEAIIFEIPRGSYMPVFRLRQSETVPPPPAPLAEAHIATDAAPATRPSVSRDRMLLWIVAALAVLLAFICTLLWRQNGALRNRIDLLQRHSTASLYLPHQ